METGFAGECFREDQDKVFKLGVSACSLFISKTALSFTKKEDFVFKLKMLFWFLFKWNVVFLNQSKIQRTTCFIFSSLSNFSKDTHLVPFGSRASRTTLNWTFEHDAPVERA